jgi:8-oxo-dGTP diphosphatase
MSHAATRTLRVVGAVVVRGDQVLVTQRLADAPQWPDLWEFPGGKVEPGETDADALERELEEELDLRVRVGRQVARVEMDRGAGERLDFRAYRCEIVAGEPTAIEVQDLRWVTLTEVEGLPMPPADGPVVAALRRDGLG